MDEQARKKLRTCDQSVLEWVNKTRGKNYSSVKEMHADFAVFKVPQDVQTLAELAQRLESESQRCRKNGQLFAAAIIGASALEAALLTVCFAFEDRVTESPVYARYAGNKTYRDVVLRWDLDHLIRLAEELRWIPSEAISQDLKTAVEETYREVWSENGVVVADSEVEAFRASLEGNLGSILLNFVREIRNLVHPGRWVRLSTPVANAERLAHVALALISEVSAAVRFMTAELLSGLVVSTGTIPGETEQRR